MMKFILQDYKIRPDFQMELLRAKEYWDWRNSGKPDEQKTIIEILEENDLGIEDGCPVGSVEFCLDWFNWYYGKQPKPINVPESLSNAIFSGRFIVNYTLPEDLNLLRKDYCEDRALYLKSNDLIKSDINGMYRVCDSALETIKGNVQATSISYFSGRINSEWRVFVYKGEIIDIKCYSGDPFIVPNRSKVEYLIKIFKDPPIAYTLDVYVPENCTEASFVMEVHDFFSCGLYGFSCYEKYPFMLWKWFKEFIKDE